MGIYRQSPNAIEYAYRSYANYQTVPLVPADSSGSLLSSFVALASLIHLPEKGEQDQHLIVEARTSKGGCTVGK